MVRGTTPIHTFGTETDLRGAKIYVTYKQDSTTIVEKTNNDLQVTENGIVVMLTQAETLRFKAGKVKIQVRYVLPNGISDVSNTVETTVEEVLKEGVIDG